jgi:hypothetical protein
MTSTRRKLWQVVAVITVITGFCVPMFADTHGTQSSAAKQVKCYCQCEGHNGVMSCPKKMCELPKYETRWWATSCHKREAVPTVSKQPTPQPSGRRTRNPLNAKADQKSPATQAVN